MQSDHRTESKMLTSKAKCVKVQMNWLIWRCYILGVAPHNVEQAKVEFAGLNFQVETGSSYLGSFIGEATERDRWIASKADDCVYSIKNLAGAARA